MSSAIQKRFSTIFDELSKKIARQSGHQAALKSAIQALEDVENNLEQFVHDGINVPSGGKFPYPFQFAVLRALETGSRTPGEIRIHINGQFGQSPAVQTTATRMNMMKRDGWIIREDRKWSITGLGSIKLGEHLASLDQPDTPKREYIVSANPEKIRSAIQESLIQGPKTIGEIVKNVRDLESMDIHNRRIHRAIFELKSKNIVSFNGSRYQLIASPVVTRPIPSHVPVDQLIIKSLCKGSKSEDQLIAICKSKYPDPIPLKQFRALLGYMLDKNKLSREGNMFQISQNNSHQLSAQK